MNKVLKAVLIGGLLSGALDIAAASVVFHADPVLVLQSVASGLLGRASFKGGLQTALLGAGLQEFITMVAALLYCLAAVKQPLLLKQWLVCGILYGAICNLVMTFGVAPLSHARPTAFGSYGFWANLAINTALYGTTIAFFARAILRPAK